MQSNVVPIHKRIGLPAKEIEWDEIKEIECPISDDWFVEHVNEQGEKELYLRLEVTGLFARRLGPFENRWHALIHLCCFLGDIEDGIARLPSIGDDGTRVVIEDELASQYRRKGR